MVKYAINNDRWLWRDGIEENSISQAVCLEKLVVGKKVFKKAQGKKFACEIHPPVILSTMK